MGGKSVQWHGLWTWVGREHFVSFDDRTRTYREFVQMLFDDDELSPDLLTGDIRANFLALMKAGSERWKDKLMAEFFRDERH